MCRLITGTHYCRWFTPSRCGKPEKNKSGIPESVALGSLAQLIHGWIPDASTSITCQYRWRIGAAAFVKSKGFRIYEFPAIFEVAL